MVGAKPDDGAPEDCPNIGDTCDDGSIYAGLSPDGNVAIYTTPADAPSLYTWNDGTSNYTDMSMANCTDAPPGTAATCQTGEANTAFLLGATGAPDYPFAAAAYCDGLSAHGYDDWYLPAQDELNVLYTNKNTGDLNGTFDETGSGFGSVYWSSSEESDSSAQGQTLSDGTMSGRAKFVGLAVRCVRRHEPGEGLSQMTEVVPNGLIGHWRLDETSGTTAFDSTGNGNEGTYQNGLTPSTDSLNGVIDRGMHFDSLTNDEITLGTGDFLTTDEVTITAWIRMEAINDQEGVVFGRDAGGDAHGIWIARNVNNELRMHWGTYQGFNTNLTVPLNEWVFVAGALNPTTQTMYLGTGGNSLQSATTSSTFSSDTMRNMKIGGDTYGSRWIDGDVDDVRIYNRALTADEVEELFKARDGIRYNGDMREYKFFDGNKYVSMTPEWADVTEGLVAHWKLDETEGTTAFDSSGNGNSGTMQTGLDASEDSRKGAVGRALLFKNANPTAANNGSTSNINTPSLLSGTDNATASLWIKPDPTITASYMRLLVGNSYTLIINNNDNISYSLPGGTPLTSASMAPDKEWTHIAITYDAAIKEQKIFINGTEDISQTDPAISFLTFLRHISWSNNGFEGKMDDVRLYDRVLSDGEIQTLYKMGTPAGNSTALPQGCPNPGDVCDDGSIYAGFTPEDGTTRMFYNDRDLGQMPWNNGNNAGYVEVGTTWSSGANNTRNIVVTDSDSDTGGFQPHQAAQACYDLVAHGAEDWYLPSADELSDMLPAITTLTNGHGGYWSSSERSDSGVQRYGVDLTTGSVSGGNAPKRLSNFYQLRCARKGPAPRCANPYGLEGQMVYNETYDVVQFCDGARWRAVGKYGP